MSLAAGLADEMKAARIEQFGPDDGSERWPSVFFDSSVIVTAPDGRTSPRAQQYCATSDGAARIANVVAIDLKQPCEVVSQWALGYDAGDSKQVPWLDLGNGVRVNAALLLQFYDHNYPAQRCLNMTELEIYDAFVAAGLKPELSQSERDAVLNKV